MTLVEEPPLSGSGSGSDDAHDAHDADDTAVHDDHDHRDDQDHRDGADERDVAEAERRASTDPRVDPSGRITYRGMRIRRVRLKSVAKISFVFWLLAFVVTIGTVVALWNVARAFGLVESFEDTMITSLGLETFEIDGGGIFGVVLGGTALLCLLGWLGTIAMAAVYNAACGALGGLAVETGPLQRRRRVFSWRHRGFVTVSE